MTGQGGGPGGRVVVAVADADPHSEAVDWAAAEAATREVPLLVVHAQPSPVVADAWGAVTVFDDSSTTRWAEQVVRASCERARTVAPDIAVAGRVLRGPAAQVLVQQTRNAALLVLGGRDPNSRNGGVGRSLHARVSARAACPVAVVRRRRRDGGGALHPRVVVGVDAAGSAESAVAFAFRAAEQRGIPLAAVHAWSPAVPTGIGEMQLAASALGEFAVGDTVPEDDAPEERARQVMDEVMGRCRRRFPGVPAESRLVRGNPEAALLAAAAGSSLLVVGCRRRGLLRRAVFGSVGSAVAGLAACPVAVVGTDGASLDSDRFRPVR